MSDMSIRDSWGDRGLIVKHLAYQLIRGRLAIVLGAGVSEFYGLPSWTELVNRLCRACGESEMASGADPMMRAEAIKTRHFRSDSDFSEAVRTALYEHATSDFEVIRKSDLLSAIGALAMSSSRGSASTIITFNYDDLLELFLEYHGYVSASIDDARHWAPQHDVVVYHPHGLLPLSEARKNSPQIVLGTSDYLAALGPGEVLWRPILQTILRTHTVLYVGLSGNDIRLQSLVHDLKANHANSAGRVRYHGVRFAETGSVNKDLVDQYENWGVFTQRVPNFDADLPPFLFAICQEARKLRERQHLD